MAIEKTTGQQLACREARCRKLRHPETPARAADVDQQAEIIKAKKWCANQRKTKYTERKLKVFRLEADILEKVEHVSL
jgi:hypothetical protein